MKVCTLASSSSGNCTIVSYCNMNLLIDAGISLRRIREGLRLAGLTPDDLNGVFVTHAHSDHINGIRMLIKHHKTPVFSSYDTGVGICQAFPEAAPYISSFETGAEFEFGGISVRSFSTPHDVSGSVGYTLQAGGKKLAYVTDLGQVTEEVMGAVQGAHLAVIEANHDPDMLKSGPYPQFLKRRILSDRGHLANGDSGSFAARLAASGSRYILLAHLSRENNTPCLARDTVQHALREEGIGIQKDVELDVAPPYSMSRVYIL